MGRPRTREIAIEWTAMIGKTVLYYRIIGCIGGGMKVVLEAEDTRLERHVALKFLSEGRERVPKPYVHFKGNCTAVLGGQ